MAAPWYGGISIIRFVRRILLLRLRPSTNLTTSMFQRLEEERDRGNDGKKGELARFEDRSILPDDGESFSRANW